MKICFFHSDVIDRMNENGQCPLFRWMDVIIVLKMFPYEIQEVINWNIYCAATTRVINYVAFLSNQINALMEDDEDRCQFCV